MAEVASGTPNKLVLPAFQSVGSAHIHLSRVVELLWEQEAVSLPRSQAPILQARKERWWLMWGWAWGLPFSKEPLSFSCDDYTSITSWAVPLNGMQDEQSPWLHVLPTCLWIHGMWQGRQVAHLQKVPFTGKPPTMWLGILFLTPVGT